MVEKSVVASASVRNERMDNRRVTQCAFSLPCIVVCVIIIKCPSKYYFNIYMCRAYVTVSRAVAVGGGGQLLLLQSVQPPSPPPVLCTERVSWPIFGRRVVSCFGSLLFFILSTRPLGAVSRSWATGSLVLLIAFAANNIVCTVRARAFARDAALLWCCSPLVPPPAHPFVFIFIAPQRKTRTHTHIHARSYDRNGIHRRRRRPFPALALSLSLCASRPSCLCSFVRPFVFRGTLL